MFKVNGTDYLTMLVAQNLLKVVVNVYPDSAIKNVIASETKQSGFLTEIVTHPSGARNDNVDNASVLCMDLRYS